MTDISSETRPAPRREGGAAAATARARRNADPPAAAPPQRPPFPPMEIVSRDEVEAIHQASLKVLEEIGMDFMLPEARDLLKNAGAEIEGERVRFDRGMVEEPIKSAPPDFTFHARNPENTIKIGGDDMVFRHRRQPAQLLRHGQWQARGNLADYQQFPEARAVFQLHRLPFRLSRRAHRCPCLDPPSDALRDMAVLTDKPFHAYSLGKERICDGIEIARIARGITDSSSASPRSSPSSIPIRRSSSTPRCSAASLRCRRVIRSSASRRSHSPARWLR